MAARGLIDTYLGPLEDELVRVDVENKCQKRTDNKRKRDAAKKAEYLRYEGSQPNFKATHYCNKCLKDTAPGLSVPLDRIPSNVTIPTSACVSNGQHCWIPRGEAFQQVCICTYGSVY